MTAPTPLVALLRSLLHQYGELTLRPAGGEHATTGYVMPHERTIGMPVDLDDRELLKRLVAGLHTLAVADVDPRLADSAAWFAEAAIAHTLAAMGVTR